MPLDVLSSRPISLHLEMVPLVMTRVLQVGDFDFQNSLSTVGVVENFQVRV